MLVNFVEHFRRQQNGKSLGGHAHISSMLVNFVEHFRRQQNGKSLGGHAHISR